MKTLKFFAAALVAIFALSVNQTNAQAFHRDLTLTFDHYYFDCIDKSLSGTWTARVTYHVDQKTGKIDGFHYNMLNENIYDVATGEKVMCVAAGHWTYGPLFDFWNKPNYYNGIEDFYDVEDGWLDELMPGTSPLEGFLIENGKYITKDAILTFKTLVQFHKNAQGEITVDINKFTMDCMIK